MNANYCRRCDKVRYSPCGLVCHYRDEEPDTHAITTLHERDEQARANDQGPTRSDGNDRRYA